MARSLQLAVTGGSDCHGKSKNRPTMGSVRLAGEHLDGLRERHAARQRGECSVIEAAEDGDDSKTIPGGE
jgi:hypothetical protein